MIKKYKVGTVRTKVDGKGVTVAVGNSKNKNEAYRTNVEIIVKDAKGKMLAKTENGFLVVEDPRKRTNKDGSPLTDEQLAKIPSWVKSELYLVVNDNK